MPRLEPIWKKYQDAGLNIVAIDTSNNNVESRKFIEKENLTYTFLETRLGANDPVRAVFDIQMTPTNLLVDEEGRILFLHTGFEEGDEELIEARIRDLLEE